MTDWEETLAARLGPMIWALALLLPLAWGLFSCWLLQRLWPAAEQAGDDDRKQTRSEGKRDFLDFQI